MQFVCAAMHTVFPLSVLSLQFIISGKLKALYTVSQKTVWNCETLCLDCCVTLATTLLAESSLEIISWRFVENIFLSEY